MDTSVGQYTFANMPPHKSGSTRSPAGGNVMYVDGSATWIKYDRMYAYSSWAASRVGFWYQNSDDFEPAILNVLPTYSSARYP